MNRTRPRGKTSPSPKMSRRVLTAAIVTIIIAVLAYKSYQSTPASVHSEAGSVARFDISPRPVASVEQSAAATKTSRPHAPAPERVDPAELLRNVTAIDGRQPLTDEQARLWKESLEQLIKQGPSSVTNIEQFLVKNQDVDYGTMGTSVLGHSSLRGALIDALGQIGGAEANAALLQVMQNSVLPTDIASIARILDVDPSGQYQPQILAAVHQQLAMAALGQLGEANVGPLYQVLTTEGAAGADVTADLAEFTEKWPYYSAIAMATLPNNAGVPGLIQMANGTLPGNQEAAAQALAELAPQNAEALNTLLSLARNGALSDYPLAQLAPFLGGRKYQLEQPSPPAPGYMTIHLANGNQDFSAYDGPMSASQASARLALVEQMLQNLPEGDSTAQSVLQEQQAALQARAKTAK